MNPPRLFKENEKGLSIRRTEGGRAKDVTVHALEHHLCIKSFNKNVAVLNSRDHHMMAELLSCDFLLLEETLDFGIFDEVLGPEERYLDTDSECEFDEEYHSFVKKLSPEAEEQAENINACYSRIFLRVNSDKTLYPAVCLHPEEALIKRFFAFTVALAEVEMSSEKAIELIARLWGLAPEYESPGRLPVSLFFSK